MLSAGSNANSRPSQLLASSSRLTGSYGSSGCLGGCRRCQSSGQHWRSCSGAGCPWSIRWRLAWCARCAVLAAGSPGRISAAGSVRFLARVQAPGAGRRVRSPGYLLLRCWVEQVSICSPFHKVSARRRRHRHHWLAPSALDRPCNLLVIDDHCWKSCFQLKKIS